MNRPSILLLCVLAFLSEGCGSKVKFDAKNVELEPGGTKIYEIDGPSSAQTVSILVTGDKPTNLYVFKAEDITEDVDAINRLLSKAIAKQEKGANHTLEASIPAKQKFKVVIQSVGEKVKLNVVLQSK